MRQSVLHTKKYFFVLFLNTGISVYRARGRAHGTYTGAGIWWLPMALSNKIKGGPPPLVFLNCTFLTGMYACASQKSTSPWGACGAISGARHSCSWAFAGLLGCAAVLLEAAMLLSFAIQHIRASCLSALTSKTGELDLDFPNAPRGTLARGPGRGSAMPLAS